MFRLFPIENAYLEKRLDMIRDKADRHHENIFAAFSCELFEHLRSGGGEPFDRTAPALVAEPALYAGDVLDRQDGLFEMIDIRVTLFDEGQRETVGAVYHCNFRGFEGLQPVGNITCQSLDMDGWAGQDAITFKGNPGANRLRQFRKWEREEPVVAFEKWGYRVRRIIRPTLCRSSDRIASSARGCQ